MTHKIAIIKGREYLQGQYGDDDYYSNTQKIIDSITDWAEVTDEEYKTLNFAAGRLNFTIITQPTDTKAFIAKTIADYMAICKAEEVRAAEEKRKRDVAALERKFKKELKDEASKKKMLKKLLEELGPDALAKI